MDYKIGACDLGKATASFAIATLNKNGKITMEDVQTIEHNGKVLDVFKSWYNEQKINNVHCLAATGLYAQKLKNPTIILPEDTCQEAQLEARNDFSKTIPDTMNLISVGASGYSVLSRSVSKTQDNKKNYLYQFLENDKCSSGTGENLSKLVNRFGYTIEEADKMAVSAKNEISITARCSVFAKSEMTHYANPLQFVPLLKLQRS